jgi:hypothetical protein
VRITLSLAPGETPLGFVSPGLVSLYPRTSDFGATAVARVGTRKVLPMLLPGENRHLYKLCSSFASFFSFCSLRHPHLSHCIRVESRAVLVWWWCGMAVSFLSRLCLRSSGWDPLGHDAAASPTELHEGSCLPPLSSPSCGRAAGLGSGGSASSHTRSTTSSPLALLLCLALLQLTVVSPKVKSTPIPHCFDSRVSSCPFWF